MKEGRRAEGGGGREKDSENFEKNRSRRVFIEYVSLVARVCTFVFLMHLAALYSVSGRCESDEGVGKKRSETRREGHTQTQVLM